MGADVTTWTGRIMKTTWPEAASALASGRSVTEAAAAAGVTRRTVFRWLGDETVFADRVENLRASMMDEASGRLSNAASRAAQELEDLMTDSAGTPSHIRLAAARSILELSARFRNDLELEKRLKALELLVGLSA